jgi:hypothetical protein
MLSGEVVTFLRQLRETQYGNAMNFVQRPLIELQEQEKKTTKRPKMDMKAGRHKRWEDLDNAYVLIRKGREVRDKKHIESLFESEELDESWFFIFKQKDEYAARNHVFPLYEAVYACADGTMLRVQKRHLSFA